MERTASDSEGHSAPASEGRPSPSSAADRRRKEHYSELKIYEEMGAAVRSSIEEFLQPLLSPPDADFVVKLIMKDDFFPRFMTMANGLADACCQKLVKIIRASTRLATVREAPTPELAKRIRDASFKPLDTILANYSGTIKRVDVTSKNIDKIRDELRKAAKTEAASEGGGAADAGAADGSSESWATDEELSRQHERLIQAKTLAYVKMVEYLTALQGLPDALLAYGCDKCFAGEVNYELEVEQVGQVKGALRNKQANAVETLRRVMTLTKTDLEQEKAFIVANIEQDKVHQALEGMLEAKFEERNKAEKKFKRVIALLVISFLAIVLAFLWVILKKF